MTVEIERKFVPDHIPDVTSLGPGEVMRQGYLAEQNDVTVRVRITERAAQVTVKAGGGLARTEIELPLSAEQAEALWPHTATRRLEKTRYRVPVDAPGDPVAEVDVYTGALDGLCTVEVEFDSTHAAQAFQPPAWFGREVTGDRAWTNASLATAGRPAG